MIRMKKQEFLPTPSFSLGVYTNSLQHCLATQDEYEYCLMNSDCSKEYFETISKQWEQCFKKSKHTIGN